MTGKVLHSVEDGVLRITLNRPEKLNALDEEMWIELTRILRRYSGKYPAVVTGSGRAFSAGDDIYMMAEARDIRDTRYIVMGLIKPLLEAVASYETPIFAAVDGYAFGAGCEILLLMDGVVASPRSTFSVPEAYIGLSPPLMLSAGPSVIGLRRSIYLSLTGRRLTSEEALSIGLIDEISEDPVARAVEIARETLRIPLETLTSIKRIVNRYKAMLIDPEAEEELARLMATSEAQELMKRFIEKRR